MRERRINVRLLRRIEKVILAEPRRLHMGFFADKGPIVNVLPKKEQPPCGTIACIAGHADWLVNPKRFAAEANDSWQAGIERRAMEALRVSDEQAQRLFMSETGWPYKFSVAYHSAKTPMRRARVAVARIEHFIKTNGAE